LALEHTRYSQSKMQMSDKFLISAQGFDGRKWEWKLALIYT